MDIEAEFLKFYMFETPWAFIDPIALYLFYDALARFIDNYLLKAEDDVYGINKLDFMLLSPIFMDGVC